MRRREHPTTIGPCHTAESDPDLLEIAESAIAKGKSAAFGWKKAVTMHADRLAGMRNQLLAQRANDVRDVGLRVLAILTGAEVRQPEYSPNTVLITEDLTPSDTAALDRSRVTGFCTTRGEATSHVAILPVLSEFLRWPGLSLQRSSRSLSNASIC